MRHQMAHRKLGRTSGHRAALFRNQLASMIAHERIITTLPKAKELRPIVEKMVTLGKTDDVHHRRQAARTISEKPLVQKLFDTISPRFAERPGGYTRIIKLGPRRGDGTEMAILEFVDYAGRVEDVPSTTKPATKSARKSAGDESADAEGTEKPAKKKPAPKKSAESDDEAEPKKAAAKKPAAKKPAAKKAASKKPASKTSKASAPKKKGTTNKRSGK